MLTKQLSRMVFACLIIVMIFACNQPDQSFRINCQIEGIENGVSVALRPTATHRNEQAIAITQVMDGAFSFSGEIEGPRMLQIYLNEDNSTGVINVFAEPGEIMVSARALVRQQGGRRNYSFENLSIEGSSTHLQYLEKTAPKTMLDKMYNDYQEKGREIVAKVHQAQNDGNQQLVQELTASEAWQAHVEAEKDFFNIVNVTMSNMILDNSGSWWGPFLMLNQMSYFGEEQKNWWEQFSPDAKNSYYGRIVFAELFPEGFTGKQAPAFNVVKKNGEMASLQSLIAGKKYTMIDFWASWCAPCIKEIPNFKKAYDLYASKGFEFIGISIDKNPEDWEKALAKEGLPWPNFHDSNNDIAELYQVKLIPSTFLIDENGVIIAENLKGEALLHKLEELLQ